MTSIKSCLESIRTQLWSASGANGSGRVAAMIGAGFSSAAVPRTLQKTIFASEGALAPISNQDHVNNNAQGSSLDFRRQAEMYVAMHGRAALQGLLSEKFSDRELEPSVYHRRLMKLPWADIFTTNWDSLLERSVEGSGREYNSIVTEYELATALSPRIVHLHGSIFQGSTLLVTESDYSDYEKRAPAFVSTVRQSLVENSIIFLGYSPHDTNLSHWLNLTASVRHLTSATYLVCLNLAETDKRFLAKRSVITLDLRELLADAGTFAQGLAAFFDELEKPVSDYSALNRGRHRRTVSPGWRISGTYPYSGEPKTSIEKVERKIFEVVAARVEEVAPELLDGSPAARAFNLRMLRSAIEHGPEELQTILNEVLGLSTEQQREFAALLEETTLSGIIAAAKTVADRLKFLTALESLVFEEVTKERLKERSQLHRILAENTWVFGEEYNLWVSDGDLKRVLERHKKHLDSNIAIDEPVKVIGKERGIIDLMFSRANIRHRADALEHMIIELKAPRVKIGSKEIVQAKTYAIAVMSDERFRTVHGIKWTFWLVSNSYDEYTRNEIEWGPDPERRLISSGPNLIVGVKTWGELITENRARLQFFQERLEHSVEDSVAIRHLQETHRKFLKGVFPDD